jgi:multidrug efflux system outer membrane protein
LTFGHDTRFNIILFYITLLFYTDLDGLQKRKYAEGRSAVKIKFSFIIWMLTSLCFLGGCFKMGPDFKRPDAGINIPKNYQHRTQEMAMPSPKDRWWKIFNNPELDSFVEVAIKNNLDIRKATARILELKYQNVQSRAARLPNLDLEGSAERQRKTVETTIPAFPSPVRVQERRNLDSHNLSLAAGFELDLWGRLARAQEASEAEVLQAIEDRRTVAQTVVSETISLYLEMEALERRIQVVEESVENYKSSLKIVDKRYKRGLSNVLDLRQARRTLAQAEASLPVLMQDLGIVQQKLSIIMGKYPETRSPREHRKSYFDRLVPVPAGLPSELLMRRPDVRAAEAWLRSLNARIGEAKASRFPRISLTGSYGFSSEALKEIFRPENELWNLAIGLIQPIFDAGRLKAAQRAAEQRYQQGLSLYAKTILNAFYEVESALLKRKLQLERREKVLNYLKEARAAQEAAEGRYIRGLVDYLSVLEAQQSRFQAEENLILVDLAILTNRITLHRSLGGGWGEPEPLGYEEDFGIFSIFAR